MQENSLKSARSRSQIKKCNDSFAPKFTETVSLDFQPGTNQSGNICITCDELQEEVTQIQASVSTGGKW
jgi:hypothetical protein